MPRTLSSASEGGSREGNMQQQVSRGLQQAARNQWRIKPLAAQTVTGLRANVFNPAVHVPWMCPVRQVGGAGCEIKDNAPQNPCSLYRKCGVLCLISRRRGSRLRRAGGLS
eukprot:1395845-Rhodomonas_salina.1